MSELRLSAPGGDPGLSLVATGDGGRLIAYDPADVPVALLGTNPDGPGGTLQLRDPNDREAATLDVTPEGGRLRLFGAEKRPVYIWSEGQ